MHTQHPLNRPPLPHTAHGGWSNRSSTRWFLAGLLSVALIIVALGIWAATSSHSAELAFEHLKQDVRSGTVWDLKVSGHTVEGRFSNTRQAYHGQVRGRYEPIPEGYSESDAETVVEFTATLPEGERDNFLELAGQNNISVQVD